MIDQNNEVTTDFIAPGHVLNSSTGNGIEWLPEVARLWIGGKVVEEAPHSSKDAYSFWYNLEFRDVFPSVTHWWFASGWTQRVRITSPINPEVGDQTYLGLVQFIDDEGPSLPWTITAGEDGERDLVYTPLPPNEVEAINMPLRLLLGQMVWNTLFADARYDRWQIVSSGVLRENLADAIPTEWGEWRLEHVIEPPREAFCRLQGLVPSGEAQNS